MIECDLHVHSRYSIDSLMTPKGILKRCRALGLGLVAVTDHNTIDGALEAVKLSRQYGVEVICGEEIQTDIGDIIALGVTERISSNNWLVVLDEIADQGALSVLPHPFRGHKNLDEVAPRVNLIEGWNSRCTQLQNQMAVGLAARLRKPITVGSDAHFYSEIGHARMYCESICDPEKKFEGSRSSRMEIRLSQAVGLARKTLLRLATG